MKTKAKYRMIDFIRPGGFWPYPYTLEQAFGVFAWMIRTGEGYCDQGQWGRHDIRSLLSGKPECCNFSEVYPIQSVNDLRNRFHYALLSGYVGPQLKKWRKDFGVTPDGQPIVAFPHTEYGLNEVSEACAKSGIDALLGAEGRLGVQLNKYHNRARDILGVQVHWHRCYRFILKYGYDGSSWNFCLARQTPQETFYAAFRRAQKKLMALVDGAPGSAKEAA